jgi:hypothetical protein
LHPALIAAIKATPAKGVTLVGDANVQGRAIPGRTMSCRAAKPAMANITRAVLRLLKQHAVETELRLDRA